ncbi:methyltransferase domain-containing protein [Sphingobium nicotianae]|uniref:Methyltransferase domain-containing protein n=1 Tax=Sphingobium nicotianae TaxID=2782607 RepID=A0A9X1DED5_9SPHN|nr:methyltransferase domain-containing protein [Sphingobium nicotianae]MBT2188390.1 methyltransferase domain-containing protein [Sphingobium nicotianae]
MKTARKALIGAAFAAAAERYDAGADVQRTVAQRLADMAGHVRLAPGARILEIGCGTGLLTREIAARWPQAELTATDIAPAMIDRAARAGITARLMAMDGEVPVFEGPQFDLILSSLTFQWFDDLPLALARLHALLRPGGSLYFATMGAESFASWRAAHAAEGLAAGLPRYPSLAELGEMLHGFGDTSVSEAQHPLPARGGQALIRHFRDIGAHVPRPDYQPLGPAAMRRVINYFDGQGGETRYHVLYGRITHA